MFNAAQAVLDKTEFLLLSKSTNNWFMRWFLKLVGHPFSFVSLGLGEFFKPAKFMFIALLALTAISLPIFSLLGLPLDIQYGYIYSFLFIIAALTIFSLPSTFAFSGVLSKDVHTVSGFIQEEEIYTLEDVNLLEQNFVYVFQRINSRVKFYQFMIGTAWGLYMLYFNMGITMLLKSGNELKGEFIGAHLLSLFITVMVTIFSLVIIVGYKRANDRLTKTIEFACVQTKYKLAE